MRGAGGLYLIEEYNSNHGGAIPTMSGSLGHIMVHSLKLARPAAQGYWGRHTCEIVNRNLEGGQVSCYCSPVGWRLGSGGTDAWDEYECSSWKFISTLLPLPCLTRSLVLCLITSNGFLGSLILWLSRKCYIPIFILQVSTKPCA